MGTIENGSFGQTYFSFCEQLRQRITDEGIEKDNLPPAEPSLVPGTAFLSKEAPNGYPPELKTEFAGLFESDFPAIIQFFKKRTGNPEEAEDLTIQVFIRAYSAFPRFQNGNQPVSAWLYKITRNLMIDRHRIKHLTTVRLGKADFEDEKMGPEEHTLKAEQLRIIRQAISKLTHNQQEAIILTYEFGLNTPEISRVLGKSEASIRMLRSRAYDALGKLLSGDESSGKISKAG